MASILTTHAQYAPRADTELQAITRKCRRMVTRRAVLSAGVAAVPIPGLDLLTDMGLLVRVIHSINHEFGLTAEQLAGLQPEKKVIAFEAILGAGSMLIGKAVTSRLILKLLQRSGVKVVSRNSTKFLPIAGQMVSAAIGFAAFRSIGNQHIDACAKVAGAILHPAESAPTVA